MTERQKKLAGIDASLTHEIDTLRESGLLRKLRAMGGRQGPRVLVDGREVLLFAGANYLDLAADVRVVRGATEAAEEYGCAAGGARLISGNLALHEALEAELARFVGTEASLLFSTGYMANVGVVTALGGPEDVVVSDSLNHASTIDGCRLSGAEKRVFRHNDPDDLARVAADLAGFRRRLLIVDGVYSMDGDVARLADMVPIARRYDMTVIVDDAHGLGVLGENGRGAAEEQGVEVDIQIGNLGKALGSFGAYVACSSVVREYLINKSRAFIFTCGLAPASVGAARAGLRIVQAEPERRQSLLARSAQLREGLRRVGYDCGVSTTHIVPAILGDSDATMRLSQSVLERGIYAHGIRFPSVKRGTARIRFTTMSSHAEADVDHVIGVFAELQPEVRADRSVSGEQT